MHTFRFVQLASFIWASCEAGVSDWVLPNGDVIMVVTARFSLDGVLLNEKARPTCKRNKKRNPNYNHHQSHNSRSHLLTRILVLVANLNAFDSVPTLISVTSIPNSSDSQLTINFSASALHAFSASCLHKLRR